MSLGFLVSQIVQILSTALTAQSVQKQKGNIFIWVSFLYYLEYTAYNFEGGGRGKKTMTYQ